MINKFNNLVQLGEFLEECHSSRKNLGIDRSLTTLYGLRKQIHENKGKFPKEISCVLIDEKGSILYETIWVDEKENIVPNPNVKKTLYGLDISEIKKKDAVKR